MKLPRDVSGADLAKTLSRFGYQVTRQTGSHLRLTTQEQGEHHISVPTHKALPLGTLRSVLQEVGKHCGLSLDAVARSLFR